MEIKEIFLNPFGKEEMDSKIFAKWSSDPEVTKYNRHGLFPYSKKEKDSFMEKINNNESIVYSIYIRDLNKHNPIIYVGNIGLSSFNWIYRSAEISWIIGEKEYWGKGLGTEVGRLMLIHGFNKLNLHRIWSGTALDNKPMQKVFDKLKFTQEGIFRDGMFLDGKYTDVWLYSILRKEWRGYDNTNNKSE